MNIVPETIPALYKKFLTCDFVSTDSRADQQNAMFFALNGPNFKGAKFAQTALEKGARFAIVEDEEMASDRCLYVENTLETLQQLALYHRKQLGIPVIGITGSNGKTTTKELTNAVLSQKFNTLYTTGNLNNHIGVPLTLLRIKPEHEMAIIEMGANHGGEIDMLCRLALPTHGIITNIGKAHLEGFGSLEGVARAKSELYRFVDETHGTIFLNTNSDHLQRMSRRIESKITYPNNGDFLHFELLEATPNIVYKDEAGKEVKTHLMGTYNFDNIAAAACIGKYFGVPADKINEALAHYIPANNRSQVIEKNSNFILLDAYNANPSSMEAAIKNFGSSAGEPKVLIAGDMFELGTESEAEHRKLGELIAQQPIEMVWLCGQKMKAAAQVNPAFKHFETKAELESYLKANPVKNSYLLIKGSRGMGLETLLNLL
ncbi:UDP-N-acetylmuramoyl-tripeptide--D-alanyl-D-alanine ligase [Adhaeribacter sp. BT258]|uniref:UDP-N-acetylmuramoyl-tripeptide--D-alanyl-D-alanine ligase n=1 Tax=Adhaeribacter terrigena TaxID=2793070 RepID=A0ABS1C448_9BACT|nr:UDP-N-acetylmuramoyl-tripeptide--D-alanyl-D-alanine ligase [Adhaeribacter terrigena]MBK0403398.1 UDP-N-acetylmuramoyl-tripeptide--D-alanyl-D-alanine ligase [Adhaeribacter terrigena]